MNDADDSPRLISSRGGEGDRLADPRSRLLLQLLIDQDDVLLAWLEPATSNRVPLVEFGIGFDAGQHNDAPARVHAVVVESFDRSDVGNAKQLCANLLQRLGLP